jgi:hypothetical protein
MFSLFIVFWRNGGRKKDRGKETTNPTPQPVSQAAKKARLNPTLMTVITKAIHIDMITDMQKPKNMI